MNNEFKKQNMIYVTFKNKLVPAFFALLRIVIGWHFLYEGMIKVLDPAWSARSFLEGSRWILGDFFRLLASGDTILVIVNYANSYGLTLIGLALILGLFTRFASWCGAGMLLMYYLAYPPFIGFSYGTVAEGNYLIVNKNLIELFALITLAFTQSGEFFGLDIIRHRKKARVMTSDPILSSDKIVHERNSRRELLKGLAGIPFLAGFGGVFLKQLAVAGPDAISGASAIRVDFKKIGDLKGTMGEGKLGKMNISRVIMGCNLMSGYAHARDLIYANTLFKAYNTEKKVLETFHLAERAGINATFLTNSNYAFFHKYLRMYNGKMQTICQTYLKPENFLGDIDMAIGNGANALYIQGAEGDRYVREGKIDQLAKAIEHIKKQGFLAGMGAHSIEVVKACEKEKIPVDFYVKTFHNDNYWSAHPVADRVEFSVDTKKYKEHNKIHDNMFDLFPVRTMEFMKTVDKPWIAFKVLASGAITPKEGFRFAFENGADFICVGMFDFQVIDDVNTANEILGSLKQRERKWYS
jgi:uncharacterized membrane protein YphA (DoxX/SURF4 family)